MAARAVAEPIVDALDAVASVVDVVCARAALAPRIALAITVTIDTRSESPNRTMFTARVEEPRRGAPSPLPSREVPLSRIADSILPLLLVGS